MPDPVDFPGDQDLRELVKDLQARVTALEQRQTGNPVPTARKAFRESALGLNAVNRVGAVTLAVGIIFFFKYAADNQWIGPAARLAIGTLVGFVLIAASEWFTARDQRIFAQGLAGCGVATLYISLYAAFGFYKLIGAGVAFTLLLTLCLAVLATSVGRKNSPVAVMGLFGALLTPQLIELTNPQTWITVQAMYLFLLNLTAVGIALLQSSRVLVILTAAMVALTALVRVNAADINPFAILMFALAILHFAAWVLFRSSCTKVSSSIYVAGHCFLAIASLRVLTTWTAHTSISSTLASIFLATYGIVLLSVGLARRSQVDRGVGLSFLGLVVAKLYLYDVWHLTYAARITAFVALGALLLLASFIYGRSKSRV